MVYRESDVIPDPEDPEEEVLLTADEIMGVPPEHRARPGNSDEYDCARCPICKATMYPFLFRWGPGYSCDCPQYRRDWKMPKEEVKSATKKGRKKR